MGDLYGTPISHFHLPVAGRRKQRGSLPVPLHAPGFREHFLLLILHCQNGDKSQPKFTKSSSPKALKWYWFYTLQELGLQLGFQFWRQILWTSKPNVQHRHDMSHVVLVQNLKSNSGATYNSCLKVSGSRYAKCPPMAQVNGTREIINAVISKLSLNDLYRATPSSLFQTSRWHWLCFSIRSL